MFFQDPASFSWILDLGSWISVSGSALLPDTELLHLPMQIAPLQPHHLGGAGDVPVVLFQLPRKKGPLEMQIPSKILLSEDESISTRCFVAAIKVSGWFCSGLIFE